MVTGRTSPPNEHSEPLAGASSQLEGVTAGRLGLAQDLLNRPIRALAVPDAAMQGLEPHHPVALLPLGTTEDLKIVRTAVHHVHELSTGRGEPIASITRPKPATHDHVCGVRRGFRSWDGRAKKKILSRQAQHLECLRGNHQTAVEQESLAKPVPTGPTPSIWRVQPKSSSVVS